MSGQHVKLSVWGLGLGMGIVGAISMLFLGLVATWWGWGILLVNSLSSLYIGFHPSITGSIYGALWGFIDWLIGGVLIAVFYNWCSGCCGKCSPCDSDTSCETNSCDTKGHCH